MIAKQQPRCRWQIKEGDDLITCWLDKEGFHSQRASSISTDPVGHQVETIKFDDLIPTAEGQKRLF